MRIAFLTTEFVSEPDFAGGLANYLFRISLALKEAGNEPVIFVRSGSNERIEYSCITVFRTRPVPSLWIRVLDRLFNKKLSGPLGDIATSRALWKRVLEVHAQNPFDIVQAASYGATNLCAHAAIPSVVRISSFEPLWRKAYDVPPKPARIINEFLEIRAMRKARAMFAPSSFLAQHVSRRLRKPVSVIEPPFVSDVKSEDASFFQKHLGKKEYALFFGTIGRLKGCAVIADMLEPLLAHYTDLYFVFIGITEKFRGKLMTDYIISKTANVSDRVLFLPPARHEKLYPVIRNARVAVLPSLVDNLPNTCIESMALGQIVIGTRGTSFEQLIDHGKSGFLCRPGDSADLRASLTSALDLSKTKRLEMTMAAQLRIKRMEPGKIVQETIDFYERAIENHRTK